MAKNLRRGAAVLSFLLVLGLFVYYLDIALTAKGDTMDGFYAEKNNSIDVLVVGSSHSTAAIAPAQMYAEQGFTAYNLFSWSQPAWTSYHYIREALKSQSPQVVVVEGWGFLYGNTYISPTDFDDVSDDFSLRMRPSINRLRLALAMSRSQATGRPVYRYLSLLMWHNRWQTAAAKEWAWLLQDHSTTAKGFGPHYSTEGFAPQAQPPAAPADSLYAACEEYFYKMVALAEKEGFALVFTLAPYIVETDAEWAAIQRLAQLCEENGVPFLNYLGPLGEEIGFDYAMDMAEHAHVNLLGAKKLTAHLGAWLAESYRLPDNRGREGYAGWDAAVAVEMKEQAAYTLRMQADASRFLPALADGRYTAFIVSGGFAPGGNEALLEAGLTGLGLPTGLLDGSTALLAVAEGGKVALAREGGSLTATWEVAGTQVELGASQGEAYVRAGGEDLLLPGYNGLFAVVLDNETGELVHSVVFRHEDGYITRTD